MLVSAVAVVAALAIGTEVARLGDPDNQAKALILLVACLLGASAVGRPEVLVAAPIVAAPFNFPFTVGGAVVGSVDLALFLSAVLLVPHIDLSKAPRWLVVGCCGLTLGSSVAAFGAVEPGVATFGAARWLAASVVALAAIKLDLPTRWGSRLPVFLVVAGVVVTVGAVIQRFGVTVPPLGAPYSGDRFDSTFGYYTQFAGFVAICLITAIALAQLRLQAGEPGRALLALAAAGVCGLGLGLSLSRGALLGAAGGMVFYAVLQVRKPLALIGALMLVSGVLVGSLAVAPERERRQFTERLTSPQGGDVQREVLQDVGLKKARSTPWGIGYGNLPSYLTSSIRRRQITTRGFHTHRTLTQIALDAGWLGLGGFLLIVGGALAVVVRKAVIGSLTPVMAGLAGALAALCVQSWNDYLFYETAFVVVVFVLVIAIGSSAPARVEAVAGL
jgi:O-Antigen ligase